MPPLFANAGVPLLCVGLPYLAALLIPVTLIEATWYHFVLRISWKEALRGSWKANFWSTLIGIPIALGIWSAAGIVGLGCQFWFAGRYGGVGPWHVQVAAVLLFLFAGGWAFGREGPGEVGLWACDLGDDAACLLGLIHWRVRQLRKAWPTLDPKRVYRQCWLVHLCTYAMLYTVAIWSYVDAVEREGLTSLLRFPF